METKNLLDSISMKPTWAPVPGTWMRRIDSGIINLYLTVSDSYLLPETPDVTTLSKAFFIGMKEVGYRGRREAVKELSGVLTPQAFAKQVVHYNPEIFKLVKPIKEWEKAFKRL